MSDRGSEERQLALLVAQATEYAIFMLDLDGHVQTWNAGAERLKGYRRDEIVGQHFSVFYTEPDRARDHPADELRIAACEGVYEEEGWRVRKDGSQFWAGITITALHDEGGTLIGFGKVSRDLTIRRLAEEENREYQRLVLSVRDYAIFMLDPAGHILSWNAGAQFLKGYTPEEIIGRHFSTFYTDVDNARDHPANELEIATREGRYEEEGWRVRKDGTEFWASVTITAIRDDDGWLTGFAKVTRDLTERKRNEEELRDAVERLRVANDELDRFASVAAHDMTDPLRTISGYAEVIVEMPLSPEETHKYARNILDSSLRLAAMLQGLLAYARAGRSPASVEPVELTSAIAQVQDDLAGVIGARDAQVVVDVPAGAAVAVDRSDLRVVLQNLIANAVKFGDAESAVVTVAATRQDGDWCVAVVDNGEGIAPEYRERVFAAFERAPRASGESGYGLGLAICQRLVDRYGGRLGLHSDTSAGTRFWFTLPAA